jgi:cell division protein FtsL
MSIGQVVISNKISTVGIELDSLQSEIAKYRKENSLLQQKVLEESALVNVSKKAKAIGFIEAKSKIYLSNPLPIALNSSE